MPIKSWYDDNVKRWVIDRQKLLDASTGSTPRYESIADGVRAAIRSGLLHPGGRMPTFRDLADYLGVSVTTVASAYNLLQRQGWIESAVGRGTFVADNRTSARTSKRQIAVEAEAGQNKRQQGWRRRALIASSSRLRLSFPDALDCSSGRPNRDFLLVDLVRRALVETANALTGADLQYSGPEPLDALVEVLIPILESDGIRADASNLLIGSSAQQLLVLSFQVLRARSSQMILAVEEPGYPTILDTCDHLGVRTLGFEVDEEGPVLASLQRALEAGANVVLLTPRAQNPTGSSWTKERAAALVELFGSHHNVVVLEDDQIADAASSPCWSLTADKRTREQTIYVRSFSKTVAPDLRIAAAVAHRPLHQMLMEAKNLADGWTSRIAQRALCRLLKYPECKVRLSEVASTYKQSRDSLTAALNGELESLGGRVWKSADGVNLWIELPAGVDCNHIVESAAALGVLLAPGEPFFLEPGQHRYVRLNAGRVSPAQALEVARCLSQAIQGSSRASASVFHV